MQNKKTKLYLLIGILLVGISIPLLIATTSSGEHELQASLHKERKTSLGSIDVNQNIARFKFNSGYNFEYPDTVRVFYVTGYSTGCERYNFVDDLSNSTDLIMIATDVKVVKGNYTFTPEEDYPFEAIATDFID